MSDLFRSTARANANWSDNGGTDSGGVHSDDDSGEGDNNELLAPPIRSGVVSARAGGPFFVPRWGYQPSVPGSPLNGPTTSWVTQPP